MESPKPRINLPYLLTACALLLVTISCIITMFTSKPEPKNPLAKAVMDSRDEVGAAFEIRIEDAWTDQNLVIEETAEINRFINWLNDLDLELMVYEEGRSPGDANGGVVYDITAGGVYFTFRYTRDFLFGGDWYTAKNLEDEPPYWDTFRDLG